MIAKPRPMVVIRSENKEEFVRSFNASLPTQEQKEFWKEAGALFNGKKLNK